MDSLRNSHLFGDAKASATANDPARKQRALQAAQELVSENPTAENMMALASAHFEIGNFEEAERIFRSMLEHHGEDQQVLVDLAFTYKNMERTDEAREMFLKAIAVSPKSTLARCAENEVWMLDPEYRPSWLRK